MIADLILPYPPNENGHVFVVEYCTGQTILRAPDPNDFTWDQLSGKAYGWPWNPHANSRQPTIGCLTGGDKVFARLMEHLCP